MTGYPSIRHRLYSSRYRNHNSVNVRSYTQKGVSVSSDTSREGKLWEDLPQPELYDWNTITFPVPLFNGVVRRLVPGVLSLVVGKNETILLTPLTITFAYLCVESPLVW